MLFLKTSFLKSRVIVAFLLVMGTLWGCSKPASDQISPQLREVVVSWNGGQLTLGEWMYSFRELYGPEQISLQNFDDQLAQITHEMIAEKIIAQRALEEGVDRDPQYLKQFQPLQQDQLLALLVRRDVDEKIKIDRQELRDYYDSNIEQFQAPATFSYYRIFFSSQKHGPERARERAEECWRLLEVGANFHDLVAEWSDTEGRAKNMLYGPFRPGELTPEVEKVILETAVRRHTPVLQLTNGYMIMYPESKREPVTKPFKKVQPQVYQAVYRQHFSRNYEQYLDSLRSRYQVTKHTELFDSAEIHDHDVLIEMNPGKGVVVWSEFVSFEQQQPRSGDLSRQEIFEEFAKRCLLLHHARQTNFAQSTFFRNRFRPYEYRLLADFQLKSAIDAQTVVSEEEMREFYENNREVFRTPATVEAWHIARKIPYPMDASEKDRIDTDRRVYGEIKQIRRMVEQEGLSFMALAHQFTEYEDGGYLGEVPLKAMPPQWVSVVGTLEEGEISQPIRVKDTFELVWRGKMQKAGVLKFEAARDQVKEVTLNQKQARERVAYIENLLQEVDYKLNGQPVGDLVVRLLDRAKRPPEYWLDPYQ